MPDARLSAAGAMTAAAGAAASWLCCMPFALGALGTAGTGLATLLGPLRPWASALSVTLIAIAFYQTYGRPGRACDPEADCSHPNRARRQRQLLWAAGGVTLLLLTLPYWLDRAIYWTL